MSEIVKHQKDNKDALNTVVKAFNDPYYEIRIFALDNFSTIATSCLLFLLVKVMRFVIFL